MNIKLRSSTPPDAEICGRICYNAFKAISETHGFAPTFGTGSGDWFVNVDARTSRILFAVAEIDGQVVDSNFLDERNTIAGVGPITVDPTVQNRAVGRRLMDVVHERASNKNFAAVRLIRAGFHTRSLSLYAKLGYDVREHLACMQGKALRIRVEGHVVRPVTERTSRTATGCAEKCTATIAPENYGAQLRAFRNRGGARWTNHWLCDRRRLFWSRSR